MGKKRRDKTRAVAAEPVAERHGFDQGGMLGHSAGDYAVNVTERVALGIDTVFACIRILSDLVADADVGEYLGAERLEDSRLVRRPMATITRRTWLWTVTATMAFYNGCYLWGPMGRDSAGVTLSLLPVSPSRVVWNDPLSPMIDGQPVEYRDLRYIPRMTFPTVTRELGSVLTLARETFAAAASADVYRAAFWEKGGAPLVQITSDQELNSTDADAIRDAYTTKRIANPGAPAVFGKGASIKPLGVDIAAASGSSTSGALGSAIARYFGVPAWLVNVPTEGGSLTYANASAAGLDLVRYTLQPGYAGPIGDALSDELPGDYLAGRRVVLDLTHLTRGTMLEQFQAYQIATGNKAWMIPSEVRSDLHMPMDMTLDETGAAPPALEVTA